MLNGHCYLDIALRDLNSYLGHPLLTNLVCDYVNSILNTCIYVFVNFINLLLSIPTLVLTERVDCWHSVGCVIMCFDSARVHCKTQFDIVLHTYIHTNNFEFVFNNFVNTEERTKHFESFQINQQIRNIIQLVRFYTMIDRTIEIKIVYST